VPVLSVLDLGVVRNVSVNETGEPEITITPTYSGCPAMDMIAMNIKMELLQNGYKNISIKSVLSPAWTTDWMTEEGRQKLKEYGIAPPGKLSDPNGQIACPQCGSANTKLLSQFGSTSCKALYQCNDCKEPFDHFKCH
jgi:ring-1,2-phenylacetyl-CoA epoxidase subunit PaaD